MSIKKAPSYDGKKVTLGNLSHPAAKGHI